MHTILASEANKMKVFWFLTMTFLFVGCVQKREIVLHQSEGMATQMADEAERMRTVLNRHFITKDSAATDGLYRKALENEVND